VTAQATSSAAILTYVCRSSESEDSANSGSPECERERSLVGLHHHQSHYLHDESHSSLPVSLRTVQSSLPISHSRTFHPYCRLTEQQANMAPSMEARDAQVSRKRSSMVVSIVDALRNSAEEAKQMKVFDRDVYQLSQGFAC